MADLTSGIVFYFVLSRVGRNGFSKDVVFVVYITSGS